MCKDEYLAELKYEGGDTFWEWGTIKPLDGFIKYEALFKEFSAITDRLFRDNDNLTPNEEDKLEDKFDQLENRIEELSLKVLNTSTGKCKNILGFKIMDGNFFEHK